MVKVFDLLTGFKTKAIRCYGMAPDWLKINLHSFLEPKETVIVTAITCNDPILQTSVGS